MLIKTASSSDIEPFIDKLYIPQKKTHKGQNGKLLIIGGSSLFHAASLWSAEIASHFVDMVHYSSTQENQKIFINLKTKFRDGIFINKKNLLDYVTEDDCILLGPGMTRGKIDKKNLPLDFEIIINIEKEEQYTYELTGYLLNKFPEKKFVIDAGALQTMEKKWLTTMKTKAIVTPHEKEFKSLFGISLHNRSWEDITKIVKETAKEFNCIIVLKMVEDIVSDGHSLYQITGGNAGLTKGGTGDALAGLIASLNTKNDQITASIVASYTLNKTADELFKVDKYWYNTSNLINTIPRVFSSMISQKLTFK
ncbi:NAD(P)H-hydrate dehydratase [Candidatus Roizmanbacteria bacterium RIFCSPHIGHO2_02_FULL_37_13b]|uniref:ADP-dependent (S)-NAD(P)H-hydrate dehydratase n=1 Tax=Candidatus Roizmanbacteria bacterium RIFCSPLOWO2_02_FULL_36_11 TaxID=1802071 RepID=A0A1F7JCF3_9BACT|nr:MAG: NAD(P)H-hydrate dehydratase [Candidatus Roizmanbacteria bacterium RIFCSPHIGHO2_02_FULL_37_13b]OGK53292.1 MAG: NAD(P)H-hydrate dehydratase [Candidatus Roizmanbacteria bacterium RIFCSPLOWO2_02_FULL_36_11]